MTIIHPKIKMLIAEWQEKLRELTGNKTIVLTCYSPPGYNVEFSILSKIVCDVTHVPLETVKNKTRKKEVVIARQLLVYYCTQFTNMSLTKIGLYIGGKDHTSVIHAKKRVIDLMSTGDCFICEAMEKINKELDQYQQTREVATA